MTVTHGPWPTEQVISAAQEGDPQAIATLLSGSHAHVRRFAHTLCSTPEDAEDAAQEALIVLFRRIGTLRATAALASWMFQIVRNECIRRSRLALRGPIPKAATEPSLKMPPSRAWKPSGSSTRLRDFPPSSARSSSCVTSRDSRGPLRPRRWA